MDARRSGVVIRRWLSARIRAAHQDWTVAREAWHATCGTVWTRDGDVYLDRTRRRLDRWEALYRALYIRGDR
jgi:hypothetical protein